MQLIDCPVQVENQSDVFYIYPIGDAHIGVRNCAEKDLRRYVDHIKAQKNAFWVGGGDYCDCVTPSDVRRFDFTALPEWLFVGNAPTIAQRLLDICKQQRERFCEIVEPIKDKCIGLIMGNHEHNMMQHAHNGHHYVMCDELGVPNLTDCAFIRFIASPSASPRKRSSVVLYITHGCGGGRTPGAEPNHLYRLAQFVDADIIIRGHSHTFRIEPPDVKLHVPKQGALPQEALMREVFKGNWGCWVKSYKVGASTYDSRANYPARPLKGMEIKIRPFWRVSVDTPGQKHKRWQIPKISMTEADFG